MRIAFHDDPESRRGFIGYARNAPKVRWPTAPGVGVTLRLAHEGVCEYAYPAGGDPMQRICAECQVGSVNRCTASKPARDFLSENGEFHEDSNVCDGNLQYLGEVRGGDQPVVSYSCAHVGFRAVFADYSDPESFLKDSRYGLARLWSEGRADPKMMASGLRSRCGVHADRARAVKQVSQYAPDNGGAWCAPRVDRAQWCGDQHTEFYVAKESNGN